MNSFGERVKKLREQKGLNQKELGARLGVSGSMICAYEKELRMPSFPVLLSMARLFNVSTDYLLGNEHKNDMDLSGLTNQEISALSNLITAIRNS